MKRILLTLMLMPFMALATTYYVNGTTGSDSNPGTSPESAKATIQAAIDVAVDGDVILVEAGTYGPIDTYKKVLEIKGVRGAPKTIIDGGNSAGCACLGGQAAGETLPYSTLLGFTLQNGYAMQVGSEGVGAAAKGGMIVDCIVRNCNSDDCVLLCCRSCSCLIYDNSSDWTILRHGYALNCTVINNDAYDCAWDNALRNCIVRGNSGGVYISSGNVEAYCYNSVFDKSLPTGTGNIIADPKFVDAANGDYRLAAGSPCIDKGDNDYVVGDTDLDGNARIKNGIVDIGCYEYCQTFYVNGTTGSDLNSGTSPESAKKTIQAAIDVSTDGDEILVAPGTYAPIVCTNKVQIVGVEGCNETIIDAHQNGRCALLSEIILLNDLSQTTNSGSLVGFTLQNGYVDLTFGGNIDGACVFGGIVRNCILQNNFGNAYCSGGAARQTLLVNCLLANNKTKGNGGACVKCELRNCTVVNNSTWGSGDACYGGWAYNCIFSGNDNYDMSADIANVYSDTPGFVDAANGDYRLAAGSPCIDTGNNDYVMGDKDLEGCGRIVNGTVDIGCYEFEPDGGPYVETVGDVDWTYMIKNGRASVGDGVSAAITTTTGGAVTIPNRLRTRPVVALDEKALANCNDITEVTIPASVKTIGDSAFEGCGKLADVYFEGNTLSSIGLDAFRGCYWDLIMHVYPTWQGRGKTICGYTVMNSASADVKMTVTNVVVHYIQTSELSPMAAPITPDVGIVNVMTEIEGGIVAVPESWATNYPSFKQKFGNDFAVALTRETGKFDANRKPMRVWQDYVAGTDPTNVEDQFRASVTMVEGKPVISYTPVLSETEAAKRVYTVYGKVKLQDEEWTAIPEGQEADYNFFKVTVKMK